MAPEPTPDPASPEGLDSQSELSQLFHKLNNQLGIILANAELLESRLADTSHRARAGQVASSALEAIETTQRLRRILDTRSGNPNTSGQ